MARVLAQRGDVPGAISELRRLVESNPRELRARIELGQMLLSESSENRQAEVSKEYGELLSVLEQSVDLTPHERSE